MLIYLVSRALQAVVVVFGVVTLVFILEHLLPGDLGHIMLGPRATPAQWAIYDHQNGLDQPIFIQYIDFLEDIVRGRIAFTPPGFADQTNAIQGVALDLGLASLIEGPMVNSLILTGISTVVVIAASVPIAMILPVLTLSIGTIALAGVLAVPGSLIADLLYAAVDPRIRYV